MSNEQALLHCTFGWGKTCRLYYDSIEVAGKSYDLKDLTFILPSYRTVLGVPSARLELSFGPEYLVLRGIADVDIVRLMVSHLQPYCSTTLHPAQKRARSKHARNLARAQARAWERTNKLPAIFDIPEADSLVTQTAGTLKCPKTTESGPLFDEEQPKDKGISLDAVPKAPIEDTSLTASETLEAFAQLANNLSTYTGPLSMESWQPPHTPRIQPPLHSVHLIPPDQKFDSNSIPVPVVKSSVLPIIHVPVRLQHGECAHYSIGATLCSDRIAKSDRATYPMLDQGLLVLTNRRVLYIGKRCQFTLAYTHLWYVSLLHTAIALHIEGQFRRIIIELEHPHEWASRIELLSFIARRARPRSEPPTVSVPAIPGLNMTVKRKALKAPTHKKLANTENATIPLPGGRVVEAKIVEAETIEFVDQALQICASHETVDLLLAPGNAEQEPLEAAKTPNIADQPTSSDMTTSAISQSLSLESAPTREFPLQTDVTQMATREFSLIEQQPTTEMLLPLNIPSQEELAKMATREFVLETATQGSQPDFASMATREFSLVSNQDDDGTQKHAIRAQARDDDGTLKHAANVRRQEPGTQGLQCDPAEILKLQAAHSSEEPQITTSPLYDPTVIPLAAHVKSEKKPMPQSRASAQNPDDDDDDSTVHLHDRKLSQLRTVSLQESTTNKGSHSRSGKPQQQRTRAPRRPS